MTLFQNAIRQRLDSRGLLPSLLARLRERTEECGKEDDIADFNGMMQAVGNGMSDQMVIAVSSDDELAEIRAALVEWLGQATRNELIMVCRGWQLIVIDDLIEHATQMHCHAIALWKNDERGTL